jgi:hypothetical protein
LTAKRWKYKEIDSLTAKRYPPVSPSASNKYPPAYRYHFTESTPDELRELYDLVLTANSHGLDYLASYVNGDVGLLRMEFESGTAWLIDYLKREIDD